MSRDPAFLRYYAKVMLREAKARRGTPFARDLLAWAARARREAVEASIPVQRGLFGGLI